MNELANVFNQAADLIERVGWTKEAMARNTKGKEVSTQDPNAVCFCAVGAISKVTGLNVWLVGKYANRLARSVGVTRLSTWNDDPERTKGEVVAAFRKAALDLNAE